MYGLEKKLTIIIGRDFNTNLNGILQTEKPKKIFNFVKYLNEYLFKMDNFKENTSMKSGCQIDFLLFKKNIH